MTRREPGSRPRSSPPAERGEGYRRGPWSASGGRGNRGRQEPVTRRPRRIDDMNSAPVVPTPATRATAIVEAIPPDTDAPTIPAIAPASAPSITATIPGVVTNWWTNVFARVGLRVIRNVRPTPVTSSDQPETRNGSTLGRIRT